MSNNCPECKKAMVEALVVGNATMEVCAICRAFIITMYEKEHKAEVIELRRPNAL